jgi:hypothetical protein
VRVGVPNRWVGVVLSLAIVGGCGRPALQAMKPPATTAPSARQVVVHAIGGETFGPAPHLPGMHTPTEVFDATPDFVSVVAGSSNEVVGYVKKTDMMPKIGNSYALTGAGNVLPVYADGGSPLVGHLYPGRGFVPLAKS